MANVIEPHTGLIVKRTLGLAVVIVLTSVSSIVLHEQLTAVSTTAEGVLQTTIRSAVLGQERELIIHLPRYVDSTAKYPVIYVLDGSSQDDHIANTCKVLAAAGIAPEAIVVGIPNMTAENRNGQLTPPFMRIDPDRPESRQGDGEKFLQFMREELIPFMESKFPASSQRVFCGHSRGALLVMYSLMFDPGMFQARLCFSAPFWRQDSILVTRISEFLGSRDTLSTFLYVSVGKEEGEKGYGRMIEEIGKHTPHGTIWYAETTPHATHQTNAQLSAPSALAKWGEYMKR